MVHGTEVSESNLGRQPHFMQVGCRMRVKDGITRRLGWAGVPAKAGANILGMGSFPSVQKHAAWGPVTSFDGCPENLRGGGKDSRYLVLCLPSTERNEQQRGE